MRHRKPFLAAIVGAAFMSIVGLSACGSVSGGTQPTSHPTQSASSRAPTTGAHMKTVVTHADFSVLYSTMNQLVSGAPIVVRGNVAGVSYFDNQGVTFTKVDLVVTKSFKGQVAAGSHMTMVEPGGVTTEAAIMRSNSDKFPELTPGPTEENTPVQVLFGGAPLTKVGDDVVYFAFKGDIGGLAGDYYEPIGAFQGKLTVAKGIAQRYVPAEMASSSYGPLATPVSTLDSRVANALATTQ